MPGDIRIVRDNVHVYVPIASMILVSVVVSLVLWLVNRRGAGISRPATGGGMRGSPGSAISG
jgi:hypothetical protein